MTYRYAVREEEPDSWTVYDIFTGWPAQFEGRRTVEMEVRDADGLAELMNLQDLAKRARSGISGHGARPKAT
jgi:hypothetical protein